MRSPEIVNKTPAIINTTSYAIALTFEAYLAAARAAWPDLTVDTDDFLRHVAARGDDGKPPPIAHAGDLFLAFACARGAPGAVAAFEKTFAGVVARVLSRRSAGAADAADAAQTIYERLLVAAAGETPRIASYRGAGPLRSWVSSAAATTAMMARRAAGRLREQREDVALLAALERASPEILHLKQRYRTEIESALVRALRALPDRQRTLLRLQLGEQMTIDQLGALYRVNRATTARWLAAAREALVDGVRGEMRARLGLSDSECDSVVALVRSELEVSIVRHLASGPTE